jgi:hypothetical protein
MAVTTITPSTSVPNAMQEEYEYVSQTTGLFMIRSQLTRLAQRLGYASQAGFKRINGYPPGAMRQRSARSINKVND